MPTATVYGGDLNGGVGIVTVKDHTLVGGATLQPVNGKYGVANLYDTATGGYLRTLYSDHQFTEGPYLRSVAMDGQHAVVSVYGQGVFVFDIESGEQIAKLNGQHGGDGAFGASIAIDDGIIVVGSPYELSGVGDEGLRGAIYTFDASTGVVINRWTPPSNSATGFGVAVAVDDGVVIVGNDRHYTGPWGPYTSSNDTGVPGPDPDYSGALEDDDGDEPYQEPLGIVHALDLDDGALLSTLLSSKHPDADEYQTSEFGFALRLSGNFAVVSRWDSDGDGVAEGTPLSVYDVRNGRLIASFGENYYGGIATDGNRIAALQAWGTDHGVPVIKVFAVVPEPSAGLLLIGCLGLIASRRCRLTLRVDAD